MSVAGVALHVASGKRETPIDGTPIDFLNIYDNAWNGNPNLRPNISEIRCMLDKVQMDLTSYSNKDENSPNQCVEKPPHINIYSAQKVKFINLFALNKGKNIDGFDFCQGNGSVMRNIGDLKMRKIHMRSPTIYLPNHKVSPWIDLSNSCLFTNQRDTVNILKDDSVRIHIPVATVQYTCKATNEFIQDVKSVLSLSDPPEVKRKLEMIFNYYGNYVVTKVTLGGAITIRDWSKISKENKSYLMCYVQWGVDYVRGNALNIFEDVLLDKLPRLETSSNIETIKDLYNWFKSLYDCKFAEITSYDEFIPSYELLPEELQRQLRNIIGFKLAKRFPRLTLIPNIPTGYDAHDILEWITFESLHNLYLCNWVHDNVLQHGVIFQRSKLRRGQKAALKFIKEPKIIKVNEIIIILSQPKTDEEAYMLENGIILNNELELDKINFTEYSSTLNVPLEDFKRSKHKFANAIYCQIIFRAINLSFDQSDIKYLQEFTDAINSELYSKEPFKNLCRLLGNDYGHLLPRTFMLGGVLSKKYISDYNPTNIKKREFIFDGNDPNALQKIETLLKEWNIEYRDIDTSIFLNNRGEAVSRNKIGDWWQKLANKPNDWEVISLENWMPICDIIFKGEILLQSQDTVIIKFPDPLDDNDYHIVGNVVKKNGDCWDNVPEATVIFDCIDRSTCEAHIKNNSGIR
ncbi:1983_t:CDS:1 [Cetraspora pellucida]|uniref:1983_t:CDS:1 n=1 Tax=Cetraspora pellucida TaxID=1433469 RepID=A0A9N9B9R3_9GLOM|nr:1983_t:CDS:1 [Cetraspora pellucida]